MKAITNTPFTKKANGEYQINTPYGGGQILETKDPYERKVVYEARSWGSKFQMGQKQLFSDLDAAKRGIRNEILEFNGIKR